MPEYHGDPPEMLPEAHPQEPPTLREQLVAERTVDARGIVTVGGIRFRLHNQRDTGGACRVNGWDREGAGADVLGRGAWVTVDAVGFADLESVGLRRLA